MHAYFHISSNNINFVGATDLGGISPIDEVNPDYPFMDIQELQQQLGSNYQLVRRLPVHDSMIAKYFHPMMDDNENTGDGDGNAGKASSSTSILSVLKSKTAAG